MSALRLCDRQKPKHTRNLTHQTYNLNCNSKDIQKHEHNFNSYYESVTGTQNDQEVSVVINRASTDAMARELLDKGRKYGKQFVVFESRLAYPTYVVEYTLRRDEAVASAGTEGPPIAASAEPNGSQVEGW